VLPLVARRDSGYTSWLSAPSRPAGLQQNRFSVSAGMPPESADRGPTIWRVQGTGLDNAVRRLAQYRPFADNGQSLHAVLRDLVLSAAMVEDGGFSSLAAAQAGIRDLWGIEVEIHELRDVVAMLAVEGRCVQATGGFRLTEQTVEELEAVAAQSSAVEETAFAQWDSTVRDMEPDLTDDDLQALGEDLRMWLAQVISRHGAESALMLYPENPRAQKLFDDIEQLGLDFLPPREGCAGQVRDRAFSLFVKRPSAEQRVYLAGLLNTSFHMNVLTIDPDAGALVQESVAGHRLYLDTNFLYALLGLSSATEALSAGRVMELSRKLGYEIAVTPWTIEELRSSLRASQQRVQRNPLPRRELAELMVASSGGEGFVRGFWIAYRDRGTQPNDFFEYFAQIETLLEEHDIRCIAEGCIAVDRNQAAIDEQLAVLDEFTSGFRDQRVREHDVKHRLLVERLRGDGHIRFSNARYFFLTRDSRLPRYAMAGPRRKSVSMPFCVSASAWLQVMRAFIPRTDDFDQSLVDLLASPYIRRRGGLSPVAVEEVVGRVDQFEGATPKLASRVLADTALVNDIERAKPADREAIIRDAFVMKAKETEQQLAEVERREASVREERLHATGQAEELERDLEAERERATQLTAELDSVRAEWERERNERQAALATERARGEREAAAERDRAAALEERQARRQAEAEAETASQLAERDRKYNELAGELAVIRSGLRLVGAAVLALLSIGMGLLPLLGIADSTLAAIAVVSFALTGLTVAGRLALGRERAKGMLVWVALVCGIVGTVAGLASLADAGSSSSKTRTGLTNPTQ
jgi:NCAIR mutase (PurE)-related protein